VYQAALSHKLSSSCVEYLGYLALSILSSSPSVSEIGTHNALADSLSVINIPYTLEFTNLSGLRELHPGGPLILESRNNAISTSHVDGLVIHCAILTYELSQMILQGGCQSSVLHAIPRGSTSDLRRSAIWK
jgi:hypothetical protein